MQISLASLVLGAFALASCQALPAAGQATATPPEADEILRSMASWAKDGRVVGRGADFFAVEDETMKTLLALEPATGQRIVETECLAVQEGVHHRRMAFLRSGWWIETQYFLRWKAATIDEFMSRGGEKESGVPHRIEVRTSSGVLLVVDDLPDAPPGQDVNDQAQELLGAIVDADREGKLRGDIPGEVREVVPFLLGVSREEGRAGPGDERDTPEYPLLAGVLGALVGAGDDPASGASISKRWRFTHGDGEFAELLARFPEIDPENPFRPPAWEPCGRRADN